MMGRSVMFSIREGPFVNGCLLQLCDRTSYDGAFCYVRYKRGSFCEWVPTGYVKGPFMMELSVMFSTREASCLLDRLQMISSPVSKTKVQL